MNWFGVSTEEREKAMKIDSIKHNLGILSEEDRQVVLDCLLREMDFIKHNSPESFEREKAYKYLQFINLESIPASLNHQVEITFEDKALLYINFDHSDKCEVYLEVCFHPFMNEGDYLTFSEYSFHFEEEGSYEKFRSVLQKVMGFGE